jgi:hypothetical protein
LTGRAVTTLTDGKLVPWNKGIDGGGKGDGYLTLEASISNGDTNARALPGDGCFQANASHPFVRLNFANADGNGLQTRSVEGAGEFSFSVPTNRYQRMMVFMTSAEGPSHLHFKLVYGDGTLTEREVLLPDYYNNAPAGDTNIFPWPRIWPSGTLPVEWRSGIIIISMVSSCSPMPGRPWFPFRSAKRRRAIFYSGAQPV